MQNWPYNMQSLFVNMMATLFLYLHQFFYSISIWNSHISIVHNNNAHIHCFRLSAVIWEHFYTSTHIYTHFPGNYLRLLRQIIVNLTRNLYKVIVLHLHQ